MPGYTFPELERGQVLVFTGEGKGKTSAALGTVLRSLGHKRKVCVIFFLKGSRPTGELNFLSKIEGVSVLCFGRGKLLSRENVVEEDIKQTKKALEAAKKALEHFDLVVLDEVNIACAWGLIDKEELCQLIKEKPPQVDLVLTGRYAPPEIIELADMVTEMVEVKHPYRQGVPAKKGIDY